MAGWLTRIRPHLRRLLGVNPVLDLHGFSVAEALRETEAFLRHAQAQGDPRVRIVYGKGHGSPGGRGVLREVVPRWLERDGAPWVIRYRRMPDATGADGAVEVWVRPPAAAGQKSPSKAES